MKAIAEEHPVKDLCAAFGVSRSGYYAWLARKPGPRALADAEITSRLCLAHEASRSTYGSPRLVAVLRRQGLKVGRRRVRRLMRAAGRHGVRRRRWGPRTTDSRHDQPVAPNRLAEAPPPGRRDRIWVGDITYVPTAEGWLYVAGVMDLWSRRVVGWTCGPTLHMSLVLAALEAALRHRHPPQGLLHHSDRGVQYACHDYAAALTAAGLVCSMSRRANCYDNAAMESFWSTLKTETGLDAPIPLRRRAAELIVFDYIETFYNPTRRHSSLGYRSPVAFENQPTKNNIKAA